MQTPRTLSLHHTKKTFTTGDKALIVLDDVTYEFEAGTSYAIVGASGSGKSTLLHVLAGFESLSGGSVQWGGTTLSRMSAEKREMFMAHHLGFVFQFHYLINELSVLENVLVSSMIRGEDQAIARERAIVLLDRVGLHDKLHAHPQTLSGGQQQRVAVARALLGKPAFLLADEPTGNLDHTTGLEIVELFQAHQKEAGMGMIIATHDPQVYTKMDVVLRVQDSQLVK
ncbi:MAG: ABC transporter ATP-binding protein [Candidatus Dependentiae bacterium]|jgi:lipoprotein-releasing system ATP-binding protein